MFQMNYNHSHGQDLHLLEPLDTTFKQMETVSPRNKNGISQSQVEAEQLGMIFGTKTIP